MSMASLIGGCLLKGLVRFEIHLLLFERFKEALRLGVVVGIAFG